MSNRFTQTAVEVLRKPANRSALVTQIVVEVLRANYVPPSPSGQQPVVFVICC